LCRLASTPLITALDAPLAPLMTPLHTGRLCLCVGGSNCEPERDRQSQKRETCFAVRPVSIAKNLQFLPRRHRTARAIRSAMEGCTPDRTSFAASQSRTIAPSLLGPWKSATLMWSPLVAQPIGWATATFPYQRHAKPSGSSPPMQKLGKSTKLGIASLEYAGEWSMGSRQMLLVFCRRAAPAP